MFEFVEGKKGEYDPKLNDNYGRFLARLIRELPNLQSFWYAWISSHTSVMFIY